MARVSARVWVPVSDPPRGITPPRITWARKKDGPGRHGDRRRPIGGADARVEKLTAELAAVRTKADTAEERADTQQERIDLAARELAEVSARLQAAADALRESL
jgi:hypothetical protein